jgi:hypothetical protein
LVLDRNSTRQCEAPNQRAVLTGSSEELGERAMNNMALKDLHYRLLLLPGQTVYPNGYDGLYWDPKTCALVIGEAKGGYNGKSLCSILGPGYGFRQGSIGWALSAASRVFRSCTVMARAGGKAARGAAASVTRKPRASESRGSLG